VRGADHGDDGERMGSEKECQSAKRPTNVARESKGVVCTSMTFHGRDAAST
jgi:hypothetical protein